MKQMKALGSSDPVSHWSSRGDSGRCGLGAVAVTTDGESAPRILVPAWEGDRNETSLQRATASSRVRRAPPGQVSPGGTELSSRGSSQCVLAGDHSRAPALSPPH